MTALEPAQSRGEWTVSERVARAVRADIANTRATLTAKALLAGSVVMACASSVANLAPIAEADLESSDTLQLAMHASTVATLVFAMVAGVVSATADFRFGRVDQLLLSDASRPLYVAGKSMVAAMVGVGYGICGAVTAVAATASFFAVKGASFDALSSEVVRPLIGLLLGAALFAVIGVAIGIALRHQAAALGGSLAWLLIVEPAALLGLPDFGRWFPGAAGLALTRSPDPNLLGQVPGGLLLAAWTAVAIGVARTAFVRAEL